MVSRCDFGAGLIKSLLMECWSREAFRERRSFCRCALGVPGRFRDGLCMLAPLRRRRPEIFNWNRCHSGGAPLVSMMESANL